MGSINPVFVLPGILRGKGAALAEWTGGFGNARVGANSAIIRAVTVNGDGADNHSATGEQFMELLPGTMLTRNML